MDVELRDQRPVSRRLHADVNVPRPPAPSVVVVAGQVGCESEVSAGQLSAALEIVRLHSATSRPDLVLPPVPTRGIGLPHVDDSIAADEHCTVGSGTNAPADLEWYAVRGWIRLVAGHAESAPLGEDVWHVLRRKVEGSQHIFGRRLVHGWRAGFLERDGEVTKKRRVGGQAKRV